jgi:sigma-B regulation protein RsbU (phosphoserine phosphatase)
MAHEIGGDFYRVYQPDKDHIVVGCFDVAGKNISGALTTMALGACFSSFELFQYVGTAEKFTNRINVLIKDVNPPGIFVAAVFLYIDFTVKLIRIHNCGFSPVLVFVPQSENKISYKISNPALPPLGIEEEYNFTDCPVIPITKGLRLCAYSDGLIDMMNIYGERYGEEQASKLIKNLHSKPSSSIQKIITKEINSWIGSASLADDVTLMDMRFN